MIQSLRSLIEVHELDLELDRRNEELSALPGQREAAQAARLSGEESVASAKQALSETELEQRHLEGELSDQESLVERLEAQVYEVKTSEAYRALQTETAQAKQAKPAIQQPA